VPGSAFIGREKELTALSSALDEARGGRGRLVLLAGEPGAGKTRLADELSALAPARGTPVFWGRSWEAGGAPAYWPWLEVLAGLAATLDDAALAQALGDGARALAEVVPALRERVHDPGGAAPPTADEARFRLWRAARGLCARAAAPAGLLIVLDDLHAADESSLLLLHFLARELRALRLLLVGTYRDVEARQRPAASELLARIGREGAVVPVLRFDRDTSARYLRQRAGAVDPAVEERILTSTQGNPLFLDEMVRLLEEEGAAAVVAGAVPQGVREVIRQRLERLPPDARTFLDAAAVAGDLDLTLIAESAGEPRETVSAALGGAARAGLLAEGPTGLRFSHALVREVLYRELAAERRRELHDRVGQALERLRADAAEPPLAELAHHALLGPEAKLDRAVQLAVRAAERSLAVHAADEAVALLERTLAAVEAAGNPARLRALALLALAEARIRRGEGTAGRALCLEVASAARRLGDTALLAEAALTYGRVFTLGVVDPVLVGLLEQALPALPPGDSPLRVRLLARLAGALQPAADMNEPAQVARDAIASARRLGEPATLLGALYDGMSALMDFADPRERLPLNLEAQRLATQLGQPDRQLRIQARIFLDYLGLGELATADAQLDAFRALTEELRAPWMAWRARLLYAMRASMSGRFAEAEALQEEALRGGRESGDAEAERFCALAREGLLRAWERPEEMLAHDAIARRMRSALYRAPTWQESASALIGARLELLDRARTHLALIPSDAFPHANNGFAMFFLAEPVALVGTPEQAARLHQLLQPEADRDVVMGLAGYSWEGPASRLLALLEGRLGRLDEAVAHFEAAIARCERLGALPYLARTRYELGRTLLERGRASDRERARALLGAARDGARALGQPGLTELCERRLAPLGGGEATAAAPPATFTIAPEGEFWVLSLSGETIRLKDSLGLAYLARLVAEPDREIHALELAQGRAGAAEVTDAGDAGELLDEEARESYRRRLEDLREALAEAESFGDQARAARTREEIEFLGAELGRAVGLGGRTRRAGVAAERARSAVQRRLRNALDRIAEHAPALAAHLERTLKTGVFCVYRPGATRS
jgi:hypothetical protein